MVSAARICFIKIFFFIHTLPFLIIPLLLPISTKKHDKRQYKMYYPFIVL